ncbi:lysophosphatidylserine lipase ABHD12 isoform X2 [Leptopilina heterotoma]|uniref:lysophosphatidylserine lipase ABHD12 isoform X2 n=1 Tax=Leptopilina heterotoma TaxID=63436 RepID=UPI001CA9F3DE|nr:lysophosphatidylserine lipase ABHD12 isoform X2 [Leptopilina heterotoma]XP_043473988.1 lysophosphatidylserine lipase ABHD12 isoform X2 [Leptopilina heterotoma]XP_043473989.1 lysophosphatidylserine lipase ABHD12 isoform X2 [Leptopilina heterotoma]XP_043473991.1 lysophosphatidylserine lipase ABHD12 isoform X2 [Leptopilina heterotoma]
MRAGYFLLTPMLPLIAADVWHNGILLLWTIQTSIIVYVIVFGLLPVIFHYSYTIQRKILFLNFVHWPLSIDFSNPEAIGIQGARNFYLTTDEGVKIGAWQVLPKSLLNQNISKEAYETVLKNATLPVILYMHGNSGNRASSHRVELYKLFQNLNYHLVCFDYRSYGDSENADLSEMGVVTDSKFVLEWIIKTVNGSAPVFVWGHSLGTGVSTHALALLANDENQPAGLFLESPFNNIASEISEHPLAQIFKHLPWFQWVIVQPFYDNHLRFQSDQHITKVKCPIMILHAEDDNVVPFSLGEKLFESALKYHGNTEQVQMIRINASHGLGHKYICRYAELPEIIEKFVSSVSKN